MKVTKEELTSYKQVKQRMPISQLSTGSEHFVDTFAGVLLYILEFTTEPIITGKYTRWNHRIRSTTSALIHKSKRPLQAAHKCYQRWSHLCCECYCFIGISRIAVTCIGETCDIERNTLLRTIGGVTYMEVVGGVNEKKSKVGPSRCKVGPRYQRGLTHMKVRMIEQEN